MIPSLADHHIHLLALAAQSNSIQCGPPGVNTAAEFIAVLNSDKTGSGWLRGVGYHESVAGLIDRHWLDEHGPARPVRIQHRGGRMWVFNSVAIARLDATGVAFPLDFDWHRGQLFDEDPWLRRALGSQPPDLAAVSRELASYGVAIVTDMTPQNGDEIVSFFRSQQKSGKLLQRVMIAGLLVQKEWAKTGDVSGGGLAMGPYKLHLHEAHLPEFDEICDAVRISHIGNRPIAVHCVTRIELVFCIAVLEEVGAIPGDRIEHASVAPPDLLGRLKSLGVVVVTQPNFIAERGDQYLTDMEEEEISWLYRCRSFAEAGIPVAAGTDAPFGHPDPWRAIRAAVSRKTRRGHTINVEESLSPELALGLFLGRLASPDIAREITVGAEADLCLLARPWHEARKILTSDLVRATWCGGELIFNRID